MAKIGELYVAITGDNSSLKSSLKDSSKDVNSFSSGITKQMGAIVSVTAVIAAAIKGIKFNAAAESAQKSFEVMLGSALEAKDMLKELRDYANKTPLEFTDIRDASQTLLQFGIDASSIMPTIKMLGDVSGGNAQKLQSLSLAFGQMSSTGRLMGQDLLQMINAGFNPLNVIAKKTGESMADLKKRMEDGGVSAQEVADAFKTATSEGGLFYGMLEKQANTLNGAFSTLSDATDTFLGQTTEGMSGPLVLAMQDATVSLGKLGDNFASFGDAAGGIITVVSALLTGIGDLLDMIPGEVLAIGTAAAVAFAVFGPWGALIAAAVVTIGLIVDAIKKMIAANNEVKKTEQEIMEERRKNWKEMDDYYAKLYPQATKKAIDAAKKLADAEAEAIAKFMQDYRDAQKSKLELINQEEQQELAKAKTLKATEKDLNIIREYYSNQRQELWGDEAKAANEANEKIINDRLDAEKKAFDESEKNASDAWAYQNQLMDEFVARDKEALDQKNQDEADAWAYQNSLMDEFDKRDDEVAKASLDRWMNVSSATITGIESVSTEMGNFIVNMKDGWGDVANAAIKAIAGIIRAMATELEASAAKALAEAIAMSLNPLTWAAAPGKYAEAGGYAAGVAGIYAAAGIVEGLANFGAGTASVPQSGSYLVGEYGPEMVTLPQGASVATNAVTEAKMGSNTSVVNNFYSPQAISAIDADRMSRRAAREQRAFA